MTIPETIREFVRQVFRECNHKVSNKLSKHPGTWETSLDFTFIEHLSNYAAPLKFEKNWVIRFDTHYLGGMRHWRNWEIADIGILILFRQNGKTIKSKISLLQSKRLYPNEISFNEDKEDNYIRGFGRLYESDELYKSIIKPRVLNFDESSQYKAFKTKDEQWKAIIEYQNETGIPIHYLFYNPCKIPHSIEMPLTSDINYSTFSVGARVLPGQTVFDKFYKEKEDYSPRFGELKYTLDAPFNEAANEGGWRLEDFISDQLITCKQGYIVRDDDDINLFRVFNRRSGPIASAFSITFDMGEQ
jgi:hypothetical protein